MNLLLAEFFPKIGVKMSESRVQKSLLNAKVNLIFYVLTLCLTFFSRKIFLDCLGKDFLGLTGVLGNILGMLNLAEMGIGAAVAFALYKPLHQGNKERIIEVIGLFGYFYKWVGSFVLLASVIVSLFLPMMLDDESIPLTVAYLAFYAFLISSLLSYFVNYKQIIFNADQRQYLLSAYSQSANIGKILLQVCIAYFYASYYAWILIELSFGVLYCIVLQAKLRRHYPWLVNSHLSGRELVRKNPDILLRTRQVFVHKLKDFVLTQCDQIFVFAYVSLGMVAVYGNYVMLITRVSSLFTVTMNSMAASIGNLIAEGDKERILSVFFEMHALRYFIGGVLAFAVYHFTDAFIALWLGEEYVLPSYILLLLSIDLYMMFVRGTVDMFNSAYGLFSDTWSAWVEGGINLTLVLVLGPIWGIVGILTGKLVSVFLVVFIWKPCYLFMRGIQMPVFTYWERVYPLLFATVVAWLISSGVLQCLKETGIFALDGWLPWIFSSIIFSALYCTLSACVTYVVSRGFRDSVSRLFSIVKSK